MLDYAQKRQTPAPTIMGQRFSVHRDEAICPYADGACVPVPATALAAARALSLLAAGCDLSPSRTVRFSRPGKHHEALASWPSFTP